MDVLSIVHFLNGLLMILLPIGLGIYLTRRWKMGWRLWFIGAGTFILSQVGHIPFNLGDGPAAQPNAARPTLPDGAADFQRRVPRAERRPLRRAVPVRHVPLVGPDARSWRTGILTGAGHGGIEAITPRPARAVCLYLQLLALRGTDLAALFPADQLALAQEQMTAYWSMTWYDSLLGAVERLFTIPVQIAFAVIVLQCFTRRQAFWVWLAVAIPRGDRRDGRARGEICRRRTEPKRSSRVFPS